MRLIDADALMNTLQELFDKREKEQMFTGSRGAFVTWNDAICSILAAPIIIPAEGSMRLLWTRNDKMVPCSIHAKSDRTVDEYCRFNQVRK